MYLFHRIIDKKTKLIIGYDALMFDPIFYISDIFTTFLKEFGEKYPKELVKLFMEGNYEKLNYWLDKLTPCGRIKSRLCLSLIPKSTSSSILVPSHKIISIVRIERIIISNKEFIGFNFYDKKEASNVETIIGRIYRSMSPEVEKYLANRIINYYISHPVNCYHTTTLINIGFINYCRLYYLQKNKKK